jgi:Tol biopolymer transport system component
MHRWGEFLTERSYNMPDDKRNREIHFVDLNTKEMKIVLATGDNHEPKFFPRDDKIFFAQYENFQFYICVIDTDGSGLYRLGRGGNPCVYQ